MSLAPVIRVYLGTTDGRARDGTSVGNNMDRESGAAPVTVLCSVLVYTRGY